VSVQLTTGSRGVRIGGSNAGYAMFRSSVKSTATHSIRQFLLNFPSRASLCAITFQLDSSLVIQLGANVNWHSYVQQQQGHKDKGKVHTRTGHEGLERE